MKFMLITRLIRAHYDKDEILFLAVAKEIAEEYRRKGRTYSSKVVSGCIEEAAPNDLRKIDGPKIAFCVLPGSRLNHKE